MNNIIIIELLSIERISTYQNLCDNDDIALTLYDWNIKLSESLYTPLNYFEIILRNACNKELTKEKGKLWYLNNTLMSGANPIKGGYAKTEIQRTYKKLIGYGKKYRKETKIESINQSDIISNLKFGFWTNLFVYNYFNQFWNPCLKYIFVGHKRKNVWKKLIKIRELRNRIFHHENIIKSNLNLLQAYNDILGIIKTISPTLENKLRIVSNFENIYNDYLKFKDGITKNPGAPLNQSEDSLT